VALAAREVGVMRRLLVASRPLNWINTALPFLAVAISTGRGVSWAVVAGLLYFLVPFNLLMYGVNDLFDYESDRRNPRKGGVEGALLPPRWAPRMWLAIAVTNLPLLALVGWLAGAAAEIGLLVTAGTAIAYSAPPLRTKVIPGLDAVTSSLHFTLPAVCGGLVAGAPLEALPWRFLAALFCWGIASQALGSIQDIEYDRAAGLRSIGTRLGRRRTAMLCTAGYAAAALIVAGAGGAALIAAAAMLTYVALAASCLSPSSLQARRAWRGFLGLNLLCGFVITQVLLHEWGVGSRDVLLLLAAAGGAIAWGALALTILNLSATRPPAGMRDRLHELSIAGGARGPAGGEEGTAGGVGTGVVVVVPGTDGGTGLARAADGVTALFDLAFQPHFLRRASGGRLVRWPFGPRSLAIATGLACPPRVVDGAHLVRRAAPTARAAWATWRRDYAGRCGHALGVELAGVLGGAAVLLGPPLTVLLSLCLGDRAALWIGLAACLPVVALRLVFAAARAERPVAVLLHPAAVVLVLAAQLCSIADSLLGRDTPVRPPRNLAAVAHSPT
jgi:4-hydroxybenzoate polyprenyltransferase